MKLKIKKLDENAIIPTRNNQDDAGLDLYALEDVSIYSGETKKIRTGIAVQLEPVYPEHYNSAGEFLGKVVNKKYGLFIWDRSGLGSKGIHRFAGVVDQGYLGEILVCLFNGQLTDVSHPYELLKVSNSVYEIKRGDKIAQLVIQEIFTPEIVEVDELDDTDRGEKGFGSSGV